MSTSSIPNRPVQPPAAGMSSGAKIILALVAIMVTVGLFVMVFAVVVASLIGFAIARTVETDPDDVARVAGAISSFELPAGYEAEWSVRGFGFSMVGYHADSHDGHFMMGQAPSWVRIDPEALEREMRESARGRDQTTGRDYRFEVVEERAVTIRGQEQRMTIGEGTNGDGVPYREIVLPFDGEGGQAMLVIVQPTAEWDTATWDAFIESFR